MLTNSSSVRMVKSLLVIEDWFAPLVAAAIIPGTRDKLATTAPIVIRSNFVVANKPARSQPELFLTDVFVPSFPPGV